MAKTVGGKKMVNGMFDDQLQNITLSLKGNSLRIGSLVSYMIYGTKLHSGTMAAVYGPLGSVCWPQDPHPVQSKAKQSSGAIMDTCFWKTEDNLQMLVLLETFTDTFHVMTLYDTWYTFTLRT